MKLINKLNLPLWKEGTKKKIYINSTANAQTETQQDKPPKKYGKYTLFPPKNCINQG